MPRRNRTENDKSENKPSETDGLRGPVSDHKETYAPDDAGKMKEDEVEQDGGGGGGVLPINKGNIALHKIAKEKEEGGPPLPDKPENLVVEDKSLPSDRQNIAVEEKQPLLNPDTQSEEKRVLQDNSDKPTSLVKGDSNKPPSQVKGDSDKFSQAGGDLASLRNNHDLSTLPVDKLYVPCSMPLGPALNIVHTQRQKAIVEAFKHGWKAYKTYAWGYDELRPLSKTGTSAEFGLGMTIIDSLDVMWLMGLQDEFDEARKWVATSLNIDNNYHTVSLFETNIRVLGGLLSTYHLSQDKMFLDKAVSFLLNQLFIY